MTAPVAAGEAAPATAAPRICQDCPAPLSAVNKTGYCRSCNARRVIAKVSGNRWGGEAIAPVPKIEEIEATGPEPLIVTSPDGLKGRSIEDLFKPSGEETRPEPDASGKDSHEQEEEEESPLLRRAVVAPANGYLAGIAIADRLSVRDQRALNAAITNGLKMHRVRRFEVHQSCDTGVYYAVALRALVQPGSQRVCRLERNNGAVIPVFDRSFKMVEVAA